jgi:hypothetical protein
MACDNKTCPKCGGRMGGPVYVKFGNVLRYRCTRCGYDEDRPPNDSATPSFPWFPPKPEPRP